MAKPEDLIKKQEEKIKQLQEQMSKFLKEKDEEINKKNEEINKIKEEKNEEINKIKEEKDEEIRIKEEKIKSLEYRLKIKNAEKKSIEKEFNNNNINKPFQNDKTINSIEDETEGNINLIKKILELENEDRIIIKERHKNISKEVIKNCIKMIIKDLKDSFEDLETIDEKKKNEIKSKIMKEFSEHIEMNINDLSQILSYLNKNKNILLNKKMYNKINSYINSIDTLKDEIYMEKEKNNFEDKTKEIIYQKIGNEGLKSILKIENNLQKEIEKFINKETILIFKFQKLDSSNKSYKKFDIYDGKSIINTIDILEPEIDNELTLSLNDLVSYNGFESQLNIRLSDDNNSENFIINVTLHTKNYYDIFLDIKKGKAYSADIVYISNNKDLLPKEVVIYNKTLPIKDTLLNMKRIVLLNLDKKELFNYLKIFPYFNKENKNALEDNTEINEKQSSDLFINIIIKEDKEGDIFASPIIKKIPNEFTDEEKELINNCYTKFIKINNKFNYDYNKIGFLANQINDGKKENVEKCKKILDKFIYTPFYINYKDKIPNNDYIEFIEKLCILKLYFHDYETKDPPTIQNKILFFEQKKKEFAVQIKDKKVRMFALIDTFKYVLTTKEKNCFNYKLMNMEDLPSYSPFIESEIKFRKIISELNDDSKISFLYLQFNSGGGRDLFSSKTFYQIKLIPLISIKNHILNDFSPYFYIFNPNNYLTLAYTNPQTNLKSYNEFCLKNGTEDIAYHQSNLNTVKILYLKFHECSHSKFSGNFNFESSPQIVLKRDLNKLYNDKYLSEGIISQKLYYKYKEYLYKYTETNEVKENPEDEENNYFDIMYHYLEDMGDEIETKIIKEQNIGESGSAFEYYLSNNYYCINGIIRYQGNLDSLLKENLYTDKSLLSLKRIIERKIKILYKNIDNDNYRYKKIIKKPGEMPTHKDLGILISI